jgi:dienelactone hydrolase
MLALCCVKYGKRRQTLTAAGSKRFADFGQLVSYQSAGHDLAGYLLFPDGDEPFPVLIFNHGSGGLVPEVISGISELARIGYAVFCPMRRGHNDNPGPFWRDLVTGEPDEGETPYHAIGRQLVTTLEAESDDVLAAADWISQHPQIDGGRIGLVGQSFGAIMTLLCVGRTNRFKAGICFAGAALTWPDVPQIQQALLGCIGRCETPLFIIQAENDANLEPTYALGREMARQGKPHEARIYPPTGSDPGEGHAFFRREPDRWSRDIELFLARWM